MNCRPIDRLRAHMHTWLSAQLFFHYFGNRNKSFISKLKLRCCFHRRAFNWMSHYAKHFAVVFIATLETNRRRLKIARAIANLWALLMSPSLCGAHRIIVLFTMPWWGWVGYRFSVKVRLVTCDDDREGKVKGRDGTLWNVEHWNVKQLSMPLLIVIMGFEPDLK